MDKKHSESNSSIPTNLLVGEEQKLHQVVISKLQKIFCKQSIYDPACFCGECRKVKNQQHSSIIWINPEKQYVLNNIAIIFDKIRFALDENQYFFFILNKAHLLSPVCANKLLKTLEEPPQGYQFFLLTNNENAIIPTIRSRCNIEHFSTSQNIFVHPLLSFITDKTKRVDPFLFEQELKKHKPSEQETVELLHEIIHSFKKQLSNLYQKCTTLNDIKRLQQDPKYKRVVDNLAVLQKQIAQPPQAGSAMLFWKKLFISLQ